MNRPEDRSRDDFRSQRMEPELELGHDSEVATAAANPPEQIGILGLTGLQQFAASGDDVDREQIVDREPILAHDPAEAAPKRQAGDTCMGNDAGGYCEPEHLRRMVELTEKSSGLHPSRSSREVHPGSPSSATNR